jgi:hypothetical protein
MLSTVLVLPPPLCDPSQIDVVLRERGFAVLDRDGLEACVLSPLPLDRWRLLWKDLPPDEYLRDGGRYRRRRYGCFIVDGERATPVPHRAHWQPVEYNALHGGIARWFQPLSTELVEDPAFVTLVRWLARRASALRGAQPWYVEAHQFRIDTTDGIGRPTPEGAHRDGVDLVSVTLVDRQLIRGGETRVFDARGPAGTRFTIEQPGATLLLDDERVIHETTPIQPSSNERGFRDTLVMTLRSGGFQGG